jgi:branched-chain amino acid transport system substrate-binding protein
MRKIARSPSRLIAVCVLTALAAAACSDSASPPRKTTPVASETAAPTSTLPEARVAFFADLSDPDAGPVVYPALQGVKVALQGAADRGVLPVDLSVDVLDTQGDPARFRDLASQEAADPQVLAAIVAPFELEPTGVAAMLGDAGLPTVSLSTFGATRSPRGPADSYRAVAPIRREEQLLVAASTRSAGRGGQVCLVGDGQAASRQLLAGVARGLQGRIAMHLELPADQRTVPDPILARIAKSGCAAVVWGGYADEGAALRKALAAERPVAAFVVSDAAKALDYLTAAGRGARGTLASCACVDLTTSTKLGVQRFINRFQYATGAAPGVYAAEGYDVGNMLVRAIHRGGARRALVAGELGAPFAGIAGRYVFRASGELDPRVARVRLFRAEGSRWIPSPLGTISARRAGRSRAAAG